MEDEDGKLKTVEKIMDRKELMEEEHQVERITSKEEHQVQQVLQEMQEELISKVQLD